MKNLGVKSVDPSLPSNIVISLSSVEYRSEIQMLNLSIHRGETLSQFKVPQEQTQRWRRAGRMFTRRCSSDQHFLRGTEQA